MVSASDDPAMRSAGVEWWWWSVVCNGCLRLCVWLCLRLCLCVCVCVSVDVYVLHFDVTLCVCVSVSGSLNANSTSQTKTVFSNIVSFLAVVLVLVPVCVCASVWPCEGPLFELISRGIFPSETSNEQQRSRCRISSVVRVSDGRPGRSRCRRDGACYDRRPRDDDSGDARDWAVALHSYSQA